MIVPHAKRRQQLRLSLQCNFLLAPLVKDRPVPDSNYEEPGNQQHQTDPLQVPKPDENFRVELERDLIYSFGQQNSHLVVIDAEIAMPISIQL